MAHSGKVPSFMEALKLRVIKTAKTTGLLSFNHVHQQAFVNQMKENEVKVGLFFFLLSFLLLYYYYELIVGFCSYLFLCFADTVLYMSSKLFDVVDLYLQHTITVR